MKIFKQLLTLLFCLSWQLALAAPGDIIFSDDFQDNDISDWTSTNNAFTGVDNATSSTGEGGTGLSMFTFGIDVTITSPQINTAVDGAVLTAWVRKGDDAFSEDPDIVSNEDLELEYRASDGTWVLLQTFSAASLPDGQITNVNIVLPSDALYGTFQIRFHQLGGNGDRAGGLPGWDVWHIDDVEITEVTSATTAAVIGVGVCESFESGYSNWTITGNGIGEINNLAPNLDNNSLALYADTVVATSLPFDTSSGFEGVRFDIQKGDNAFSEYPDNNEDLVVEYLNNVGTWVEIGVNNYQGGGGGAGQFFNDETFLTSPPASAQHANFQLRFTLTDSSGAGTQLWDYWHIDDVCILATDAVLQVVKTVEVESDPVNLLSNPKAIAGSYSIYTIDINETAGGTAINNSLILTDVLPDDVSLFVGNYDGSGSPFEFTDGLTSSGISYVFSSLNNAFDDVDFLDAGGTVITNVTADGDGFASAVRQIRIRTAGIFQANGSFELAFRVRTE